MILLFDKMIVMIGASHHTVITMNVNGNPTKSFAMILI
jgi:hypothetical protein